MTLAIYKQLQRDGTKLHAERPRSSKQTMLIEGLTTPDFGTDRAPQREKVNKKRIKQLAGPSDVAP
jgi:hypothetical protein